MRAIVVLTLLMFAGCATDDGTKVLSLAIPDGWSLVDGYHNYVVVDSVFYAFVGPTIDIDVESDSASVHVMVAVDGPDGCEPVVPLAVGGYSIFRFESWAISYNTRLEAGRSYDAFGSQCSAN